MGQRTESLQLSTRSPPKGVECENERIINVFMGPFASRTSGITLVSHEFRVSSEMIRASLQLTRRVKLLFLE